MKGTRGHRKRMNKIKSCCSCYHCVGTDKGDLIELRFGEPLSGEYLEYLDEVMLKNAKDKPTDFFTTKTEDNEN